MTRRDGANHAGHRHHHGSGIDRQSQMENTDRRNDAVPMPREEAHQQAGPSYNRNQGHQQ